MSAIVSFCSGCLAIALFFVASLLFRPVGWEDGGRQINGVQMLLFIASALAILIAVLFLWAFLGELREMYRDYGAGPPP